MDSGHPNLPDIAVPQLPENIRALASFTERMLGPMRSVMAPIGGLDDFGVKAFAADTDRRLRTIRRTVEIGSELRRLQDSVASVTRFQDSMGAFRRIQDSMTAFQAIEDAPRVLSGSILDCPGGNEHNPQTHHSGAIVTETAADAGVRLPARDRGRAAALLARMPPVDRSPVPVENRQAYDHVFVLENALRRFLEEGLTVVSGNRWVKQRVPEPVRRKWCRKREDERRRRHNVGERLVAYADLDDYRAIIVCNENWRDVFSGYFRRKGFVEESLTRLHHLRNPVMHCRPLNHQELLVVLVETRQLLRAMGMEDELPG